MKKHRILEAICTYVLAFCLIVSCTHYTAETKQDRPPNEKLSQSLTIVEIDGTEGVVLPLSHAPAALTQCSRQTLGPGEAYWVPTVEDLKPLEQRLSSFIRENPNPIYSAQWSELEKFKRQYAGVIRNGRKMIYVNLFPNPTRTTPVDWTRQVIVVCDGGPKLFGVEYDVEIARFTHIAYNGIG